MLTTMNAPAVTEVVLKIGQFYFGGGQTKIRTLLGSCVSITMWHPRLKIGGMCHYMLPQRGTGGTASVAVEGNYADEVMDMFLRELRKTGTQPKDYIVKLFGGGCMFVDAHDTHRPPTDVREVSTRNIAAGRALLANHGFTLSAEHTGGYGSRVLVFELWSGDVWIRRGQAVPA
ncbi:chemotaxis protein CheD [Steroidobacter flavus]|uniref:Probable chemoreceptor glutamine deamidase CheD n=1 Tax=Steroidobacter flavus TaxID=1842136 RepID=A0ABV8SMT8_9GAMM